MSLVLSEPRTDHLHFFPLNGINIPTKRMFVTYRWAARSPAPTPGIIRKKWIQPWHDLKTKR